MIRHLSFAPFDLYFLGDGTMWLDGGAMFGVVPKAMWHKVAPPDAGNRIELSLRPLLIRAGNRWILVETGIDDKPGEKHRKIYRIDRSMPMLAQLWELGLKPGDIDLVINTHLHFDHCGGNTRRGENGEMVPMFPHARYLVQGRELDAALEPHERNQASYLPDNILPIDEAGLFDRLEGEEDILPGLSVLPLPGHTLGQQGVVLQADDGRRLVYTADLLPTLAHAPIPWIMAYDLYPMITLETRKRHFPQWAEEGWLIAPPHDPRHALGRLVTGERGIRAEAAE